MANRNWTDVNWNLGDREPNDRHTAQEISLAVLLDIREELRRVNATLRCPKKPRKKVRKK